MAIEYNRFTGFEDGGWKTTRNQQTNGDFNVIEINSTSPISGNYDLHARYVDDGNFGTGCWARVAGGPPWRGQTQAPLIPTTGAGGFDLNFKFKTVQAPVGLNIVYPLILSSNSTSNKPVGMVITGNSGGTIGIQLNSTGGNTAVATITSGTTYDIRMKGYCDSDGDGFIEMWVFTTGTNTVLGYAKAVFDRSVAGANNMVDMFFGCTPFLPFDSFLDGDQDYYFDDIVVKTGSDISACSSTDPGSGAVIGLLLPNADGATTDWTPSAGSDHFALIDDGLTWDDSDWIQADAGTPQEFIRFTNYSGGNNLKAQFILVTHGYTSAAANDVLFNMGIYDGTDTHQIGMQGWSVESENKSEGVTVGYEIGDGSPFSNAYSDGLELYLKMIFDLGFNEKRVSWATSSVYDDTGRTPMIEWCGEITGTATASIDEADIVDGGKTIIITLTGGAEWVTAGTNFNAQRQNIIDGLDAATSPANGWNDEVRDKEVVTAVVRTSATVVTVTLSAQAGYDISAQEVITVTIPYTAVDAENGDVDVVATPTITVDQIVVAPDFTPQMLYY